MIVGKAVHILAEENLRNYSPRKSCLLYFDTYCFQKGHPRNAGKDSAHVVTDLTKTISRRDFVVRHNVGDLQRLQARTVPARIAGRLLQ